MLEQVKYTTISQICTKDLIFYDRRKIKELSEFCELNHITFLPSKDRLHCYKLYADKFTMLDSIPDDLKCNPHDLIFEQSTLDKFTKGNHDEVMFVIENGMIKGVVHIVDYNNNELYVELYRLLLNFEKNLRKFLIFNGKTNNDILEYFKQKGKKNNHFKEKADFFDSKKGIEQLANSNELEAFYLRDLLMFLNHTRLVDRRRLNIDCITEIRNWVAHSKEVININSETEHPIYNISGLKNFISNVRLLFDAYDYLEIKLIEAQP